AILCARGAVAAGAGLVTVAVPERIQDVVANAVPPAMTVGLDDTAGVVAPSAAATVAELAAGSDAVVAGPGMTPAKGTREVVDVVLEGPARVVLDADALNVFRDDGSALAHHTSELVLTPHMRELARIGPYDDADDAWDRRAASLPAFAAGQAATIVAKGPGTLVAAHDGRVWVTPTGGPALATGGSGDVLAGAVAAAVARADDVAAAVARACWWHGLAGQIAGAAAGDLPGSEDIAAALPDAVGLTARLARVRPRWPFDPPGWRAGRTPPMIPELERSRP
ncbi:MAG: NAD(P)H-hydrate dehydratase, partial [Nitriliruptorales bacterium]